MNVVPHSTMNTNGGTELTLKCKLKCFVKPMKDPLGVSPSKGTISPDIFLPLLKALFLEVGVYIQVLPLSHLP